MTAPNLQQLRARASFEQFAHEYSCQPARRYPFNCVFCGQGFDTGLRFVLHMADKHAQLAWAYKPTSRTRDKDMEFNCQCGYSGRWPQMLHHWKQAGIDTLDIHVAETNLLRASKPTPLTPVWPMAWSGTGTAAARAAKSMTAFGDAVRGSFATLNLKGGTITIQGGAQLPILGGTLNISTSPGASQAAGARSQP